MRAFDVLAIGIAAVSKITPTICNGSDKDDSHTVLLKWDILVLFLCAIVLTLQWTSTLWSWETKSSSISKIVFLIFFIHCIAKFVYMSVSGGSDGGDGGDSASDIKIFICWFNLNRVIRPINGNSICTLYNIYIYKSIMAMLSRPFDSSALHTYSSYVSIVLFVQPKTTPHTEQ